MTLWQGPRCCAPGGGGHDGECQRRRLVAAAAARPVGAGAWDTAVSALPCPLLFHPRSCKVTAAQISVPRPLRSSVILLEEGCAETQQTSKLGQIRFPKGNIAREMMHEG